jgi:hypothetical protein
VGGIIAYLLFFLAGLGFGYAAEGKWRWLPLLFPAAPPATSILVTPRHARAG